MTAPTAFPLAWPHDVPRWTKPKAKASFQTGLSKAIKNVQESLRLFANDTGKVIPAESIVMSSNVGGLLAKGPEDPAVAVYFTWDGEPFCFAVDRYAKVEHNLQAIHHLIEGRRTDYRHGGLTFVKASFKGLKALPAPSGWQHWTRELGLPVTATADQIKARKTELSKVHHPDKGGDPARMQAINRAVTEALAEVG